MKYLQGFFVSLILLIVGPGIAAADDKPEPADTIYRNGVIYRVDAFHTTAEAVAVRDGKFVAVGSDEEIKEFKPQVVALSGFLTVAFDSMKETIEAIKEAGMRDDMKIQIGGGQIDETVRAYTGADGFGLTAIDAVEFCKQSIAA